MSQTFTNHPINDNVRHYNQWCTLIFHQSNNTLHVQDKSTWWLNIYFLQLLTLHISFSHTFIDLSIRVSIVPWRACFSSKPPPLLSLIIRPTYVSSPDPALQIVDGQFLCEVFPDFISGVIYGKLNKKTSSFPFIIHKNTLYGRWYSQDRGE